MYYVNREQIEKRLRFIPDLNSACRAVVDGNGTELASMMAQERLLHLAVETVTDVGSLLIDGFLMRDASSYEDIVEILRGEQVFSEQLAAPLKELVKLRKPLVQEYVDFPRNGLHPLLPQLPQILDEFGGSVRRFMEREFDAIS